MVVELETLISRRHAELLGKSAKDAKSMYMDFVRSRPLFGATIFVVMVCFDFLSYLCICNLYCRFSK
jgi:hypothetical protein